MMDRFLAATHAVEREHWWFQGLRLFARTMLLGAGIERADRVLDCGCGTGGHEPFLATFGATFGIDRTFSALRSCRADGWPRVANASAACLPFPGASFDLVTSFDVLYCLPDEVERAALTEMRRVLAPGGHLLVNVCAFDVLRGSHSVAVHELRRYTAGDLRARLTTAGFSIVRISYLYASLFFPLAVARTIQRLAGLDSAAKAPTDFGRTPAPLSAFLGGVVRAEASLLRHVRLPFGSSVMGLARR